MTLFLIELVDFHGHKQLINLLKIPVFPAGIYIFEIVIVKYNVHARNIKKKNLLN